MTDRQAAADTKARDEQLREVLDRLSRLEAEVGRNASELSRHAAALSDALTATAQAHAQKLDLIDEALAGWTEDIERAIAASAQPGEGEPEETGLRTELLGARLAIRAAASEAVTAIRAALDGRPVVDDPATALAPSLSEALAPALINAVTSSITAELGRALQARAEPVGAGSALSPAEIASAVGEIVPAAMAASLSQLVQSSFESAESSRAAMIDAIRKDLIALATTIKAATDNAARTVAEQATQAASAAADAAERAATAATEIAATVSPTSPSGLDRAALDEGLSKLGHSVDAQLATLAQRIDELTDIVGRADVADGTRDRVASDVSERLTRLREAAAGVGDAVRAEAQRRRRRA